MVQENHFELQQQLQQLRVAQGQQAEEIQRLEAHQNQPAAPNIVGTGGHSQDDSSGARQVPTVLQVKQHQGQKAGAGGKASEAASIIRHASLPWPSVSARLSLAMHRVLMPLGSVQNSLFLYIKKSHCPSWAWF